MQFLLMAGRTTLVKFLWFLYVGQDFLFSTVTSRTTEIFSIDEELQKVYAAAADLPVRRREKALSRLLAEERMEHKKTIKTMGEELGALKKDQQTSRQGDLRVVAVPYISTKFELYQRMWDTKGANSPDFGKLTFDEPRTLDNATRSIFMHNTKIWDRILFSSKDQRALKFKQELQHLFPGKTLTQIAEYFGLAVTFLQKDQDGAAAGDGGTTAPIDPDELVELLSQGPDLSDPTLLKCVKAFEEITAGKTKKN